MKPIIQFITFATITALVSVSYSQDNQLTIQKTSHLPPEKTLFWNLSLGGTRGEDPYSQKTLSELTLSIDANIPLTESIYILLSPEIFSESGFRQDQQTEGSKTEIRISNAEAKLFINKYWSASAGALSQAHLPRSIISRRTFPAAKIAYQDSESGFKAFFQSAVPTSSNLASETRDFEPIPNFFTAGGEISGTQSTHQEWQAKLYYFKYQNLPSSVAMQSSYTGNSSMLDPDGTMDLKYLFEGYVAYIKANTYINPELALEVSLEGILNSKAPSGTNRGQILEIRAPWKLNNQLVLAPIYTYFEIQPDATVSAYSSSQLQTNRVGYLGGAQLTYNKNLSLLALAGERSVIYESSTQFREKQIELRLESTNVPF